jgi:hypothetical protein
MISVPQRGLWLAVAILVAAISSIAVAFNAPPSVVVADVYRRCSNTEVQSGVEAYLRLEGRRFGAYRLLIDFGRASHARSHPPSRAQAIFDWHKAGYLARYGDKTRLANLLCSVPSVEVDGVRTTGVESIAAQLLGVHPSSLTQEDAYLVSCGVIGWAAGTRQYVTSATAFSENRETLAAMCE